jgi:hypothetical protein
MPNLNTQITPPRVPLTDERTGAVSREWYRWFYNIYNITGGALGITPVINGGTGLGTIPTNGQLLIGNGTGYTLNTLGTGAGISVTNGAGTITVANTGVLSFAGGTTGLTPAAATTGAVTLAGTLIAVNGGTGFGSYAVGDLLYANTTTTLAKLPDVATGNALISGGVGVAPAWGKIGLTTHVSGVLPIANGGTNGSAAPTAYGVAYGTGTAYAFTAAGTTKQALLANTGAAPTWSTLTTGASILYGDASGGFSNVTIGTGVSFVAGTLSATGTGGTVTAVTGSGNIASSGGATPNITFTGTLPIANGGTNATTTPTAGAVAYGTGTAYAFTLAGTAGQVLTSNGAGVPTWTTNAGGDVTGPASSTDNAIARFDGTTGKLIQNSVTTIDDTGAATGFTTFSASTSVTTPIVQASNSAGLSLKNASGTTQMNVGAGGGDNMSINVSTNLNGANAQIDLSPTGTGHVHIKPTGVNSVEIAPTFVGEMDNITIGATTPKNGSFVDLSVTGTTSFDGSQGTAGQVLTSAGTGATPTWTTPTTGTVTSVSVVSANGLAGTVATATTTPAITLSTTVTGLLKGNGTAISAAVANTDYVPLSTVLTKTADYTITGTDTWIINNKTGSALTLTFPAASSWTGRYITVKNMQAQAVNSASSNIVPIDSTSAGTAILLAVVGNWATMVSDGTNWVIMQAASNNNLLLE